MGGISVLRGCSSVLSIGLAAVAGGSMAFAQETPGDSGAQAIDEVIVTAQRRVQNLQDVPISALVFTGDMLESKGVEGLYSLQYAAPSLTVAGYGSANVLNIRGIGRSAVDIELPSGVVIYRDGFPTFPGYFQNERYFDIASIEVLRGPQGTFVGKSAAGGAIFIRTAAPDLSGFSGMVEGEVGNFDHLSGTLVVNAPLTDEFGVRLAYQHVQRDKILVDSLAGPYTGRPGRPELDSLRLGALWNPTDRLSAQARVDLSDLDFGGNLTSSYGFPLYDLVQDVDYRYLDRSVRAVGDIKYTFDRGLVLSSVSGYQRAHTWNNFDRNGNQTPVNRFESEGVFELYSQEFNLISPDDVGPFSYVVGLFFQRTDSVIFDWRRKGFNVTGEAGDLGGLVQGSDFPYLGLDTPYTKREDEVSAFVDFKYALSDSVEAELGIRYSTYELSNDTNIVIGDGVSPPTIPFFAGMQELDEDDVDAKLSLTWSLNDNHNVYALIARGHVNGGFNIIGGAFFEKQRIYDYEAGWKSTLAGGRVRTQLGGYYQTFSNYQAQFASEDLPGQNLLQNADGKSTVYGFEASLQARFGEFSLDTSLALLRSELGTFPRVVSPFLPPPDNIISISGGKTPFAPEFSLNVGASYRFDLGADFMLTPRLDLARVSEQSGSLIVAPNTRLAGRTLLNGGVRLDKNSWYVDLGVTNITDERYVAGIQDLGNVWYPGDPRLYQVKVGTTF
jgi:iron complex outermembrane receptor protein